MNNKQKKRLWYIGSMILAFVLVLIGITRNVKNVNAASFDNGYYCETVQGTLKAEYTVDGGFGEYNQTTSPDDRCDTAYVNVSESLELPVQVNVRRNVNSATYTMSVDTTSKWSARDFCHGDNYEYEQGSWINCGGTTYFNFTADGTHDLTGINTNESSEQTVDLTSKGCTYSVDVVFDDNPDWVVDWYNIRATLDRMTLTFTYPPFPEYTVQYDSNGGSGYMPSEIVKYSENFTLKANAYTKSGYVFKGWAVIREADGRIFCDNRGWTPINECQPSEWHIYGTGEQYVMDPAWFGDRTDGTFTFCAQWEAADRFVNYMGNEADNKEDYYQFYSAASENRFNVLDFKKTGHTTDGNWVYKDQFMNTVGGYAGDGTAVMPGQSGLTSIRTKCGGRYDSVDINAASTENGANVQLWDCVNGNAQMFAFQYVRTENNVPYWVIKNNYSGKVLDVNGTAAGANVQQYAYHGGDNQLWTLKMAGNGYFYICSKLGNCTSLDSSSLVLDLWGYSTDNGTNITISGYHGGDNQQWYLWDNTINLSVDWANNNYKVAYNADGGTLLDENGNETTDTVRTYEYDKIYSFLKAERAYTVSYETNGGTASIMDTNTNAAATFNGWNEQLTEQTSHGEVNGWDGWSVGTWNWAAYYNGNPDLLRATNNTYDTMWAILHYREHGIDEGRTFNGASYWLPALSFKNLTANGGTVNVKADYTNGSVTLPKAEKASVEIDGKNVSYTFDGWYLDAALTNRVGGAGDTYTPAGNTTLYANFTESSTPNSYIITVEHYLMDIDGTYPDTPHETTSNKYKSGYQLNVVDIVNEYDGYQCDSEKTQTVNGQFPVTVTQNITLKVYYQRNKYTVTYNVSENGGNWSDGSAKPVTRDYYWGQDVDLALTAQKTDYDFMGWNTDSTRTEAIKSLTMPQEDITLYALYSGDLTAKFVDSFGVRTVTGTRYNNTKDVVITVPDIRDYAWDGVTSTSVIGWNSNTDINAAEAKENEITTDTITISSNVTFYAVYSAEVTLTYDLNGADESQQPAPVTVTAYANAYNLTAICGEKVILAQAVKHTLEAQEGYIDSYVQTAWAENSLDGKSYAPGGEYNLTQNTVMYALWDGEIKPITYTIHFDGNGSTAGEMQDINVKYDEQVTLPDNDFARTTDWGDSTFMGWNRTADTKTIEFSNQDIVSNLSSTDGDVVTLYAIWDDCPEITAKDRYFTLQEAQNGLITEEKLLETASAADDIDTDINDKIYVKYYSENEWKQFTTKGSSLIKYEVIDSSGNVSNCTATVYIVDTTAQEVDDKRYARFINERYYNKSFEEGGLEDNSIWKLPEYAEVLEDAMQNRISLTEEQKTIQILGNTYTVTKPGSISRNHVYQIWEFAPQDIKDIREFVNVHGLGKYKEENALTLFHQDFVRCIKP
jgi:uncharacterized repeat protein (TIGR02543 family)